MKGIFARYGLAIGFLVVFLVSVLANFAFHFNIPANFFLVVGFLSAGVCGLITALLLRLHILEPEKGIGYSPLGTFFMGIALLSLGLRQGLEYVYADRLPIGVEKPLVLLCLLFLQVGIVIEHRAKKKAHREQAQAPQ